MVENEKSGNTDRREHGVLGDYVAQRDGLIEKENDCLTLFNAQLA
jgi:hypothetical protein